MTERDSTGHIDAHLKTVRRNVGMSCQQSLSVGRKMHGHAGVVIQPIDKTTSKSRRHMLHDESRRGKISW